MVKWRSEIIGPWIVDPDGQQSKKLSRDYAGCFISDVTGQTNLLPEPNLVAVVVTCEADVMEAIMADNEYLVVGGRDARGGDLMPTKKDKGGVPDANEFGMIRSFLARNGVSQAQITAVIGTGAQGRSKADIAALLRAWMRTLPRAGGIVDDQAP